MEFHDPRNCLNTEKCSEQRTVCGQPPTLSATGASLWIKHLRQLSRAGALVWLSKLDDAITAHLDNVDDSTWLNTQDSKMSCPDSSAMDSSKIATPTSPTIGMTATLHTL